MTNTDDNTHNNNTQNDVRSKQRFETFMKALRRYEEAATPQLNRLEEEGLIQRFEYTFELAWKYLQDILFERGYADVRGPRPVIERAFQDGIISNGATWLEMLKARNQTTHLYDEATFQSIITNVRSRFLVTLQELADAKQS